MRRGAYFGTNAKCWNVRFCAALGDKRTSATDHQHSRDCALGHSRVLRGGLGPRPDEPSGRRRPSAPVPTTQSFHRIIRLFAPVRLDLATRRSGGRWRKKKSAPRASDGSVRLSGAGGHKARENWQGPRWWEQPATARPARSRGIISRARRAGEAVRGLLRWDRITEIKRVARHPTLSP